MGVFSMYVFVLVYGFVSCRSRVRLRFLLCIRSLCRLRDRLSFRLHVLGVFAFVLRVRHRAHFRLHGYMCLRFPLRVVFVYVVVHVLVCVHVFVCVLGFIYVRVSLRVQFRFHTCSFASIFPFTCLFRS